MFSLDISNIESYSEFDDSVLTAEQEFLKKKFEAVRDHFNIAQNNLFRSPANLIPAAEANVNSILQNNPWLNDVTMFPEVLTPFEQLEFDNFILAKKKELRTKLVSEITVTTSLNNTFDGNEDSQGRMSRAIAALPDDITTISWKLADNTVIETNKPELLEALQLAGLKQTELWMI